jgi:hypothetical protein
MNPDMEENKMPAYRLLQFTCNDLPFLFSPANRQLGLRETIKAKTSA